MKSNLERTSTLTSFAPPGSAPLFGPPRVALVHDWLTGMRGGERVLEVLCEMFPTADLYTLVYRPERVSARISRMRVTPSILQRMPGAARHYRWWLPIFPWAIERVNLSGYDLVISVSHAVAMGVRVAPGGTVSTTTSAPGGHRGRSAGQRAPCGPTCRPGIAAPPGGSAASPR